MNEVYTEEKTLEETDEVKTPDTGSKIHPNAEENNGERDGG